MPTAIRLRGVPHVFTSYDHLLSFLRSSPGYVNRQRGYLETYWSGALRQAGYKPPKVAPIPKVQNKARDQYELQKHGFVGASQRANARAAYQRQKDVRAQAALNPVRAAPINRAAPSIAVAEKIQAQRGTPTASAAGLAHVPGGTFLSGGLAQVGTSLLYAPAGVKQLVTHPLRTVEQIPGQLAQDVAHPIRRRGYLALDLLAGAGALAKLGRVTGALDIPATRTLGFEGGRVQPLASPSDFTRLVEHRYDRFSEAHPNLPFVGAADRVAARIPFEAQRRAERSLSPVIPLQTAARKLGPRERIAYSFLKRYGPDTPEQARGFLDKEIQFRESRLAGGVKPVERAAQHTKLLQLRAARDLIEKPTPALERALAEGRALTGRAQESRLARGAVTPETATERVNLPARVIAGEVIAPRSAQLTLDQHFQNLGPTVTKERPRSRAEAEHRLAELEQRHQSVIDAAYERIKGPGPLDPGETKWRNTLRGNATRVARGRAKEGRTIVPGKGPPTLQNELRQQAADSIDATAQAHASEPWAQRYLAERDEIGRLRGALQEGHPVFGTGQADYGTHTFTAREPIPPATVGPHGQYERDVARVPPRALFKRSYSTSRPREYIKPTTGTLYKQGRFRVGPNVTVEDFAREARHRSQLENVQHARQFAKPLNHEASPTGLEPGHVYFNPEGHKLPAALREQPSAEQALELTPNELDASLKAQREAVIRNTFPDEATLAQLPPNLQKNLGQIDERIANAFRERQPLKIGQTRVGRALGKAFDLSNSITKAGLIYLKASFVPANFIGDTIFLTLQQGPWAGANLLRASRILGDLSPEVVRRLRVEAGAGPALGIAQGSDPITHRLAEASNLAASGLTRPAALIHEYAKAGIKTDKQYRDLFAKVDAGDQEAARIANQASEAGSKAVIDYGHLPRGLQEAIGRLIFILPWVYGSTRYAVRLPLDHPLAAVATTKLGEQGNAELTQKLGRLASYLDEIIPVGKAGQKLGVTAQPVIRPSSATPFGSAIQVGRAIGGLTKHGVPASDQPAQFLNPLVQTGIEAATHYDIFHGKSYPASKSSLDIVKGGTYGGFPALKLAQSLISPTYQKTDLSGSAAHQPVYVPASSAGEARKQAALGFLGGGFAPRELNVGAAQQRGQQEARATLTPVQRALSDGAHNRALFLHALKQTGLASKGENRLRKPLRDALVTRTKRQAYYAEKGIRTGTGRYYHDAFEADTVLLLRWGKLTQAQATKGREWAKTATEAEIKSDREKYSGKLFGGDAIADATRLIHQRGMPEFDYRH